MKKSQRESFYWNTRHFKKVYNSLRHYYKHVCSLKKGKRNTKLIYFFERRH
jgi:hypothetical protein